MMKATKYKDLQGRVIHSDNAIHERGVIHGRGTIVKEHTSLKPSLAMCAGCRDDFYNGNNSLGVKRCWSFDSATVVDKIGHSNIHVMNGVDTIKVKTLSCWNAVSK